MSGAYQEARRTGFDEKQARFYSAGIGASEAVLSYTIGGISKLGGKLSGNIISKTLEGIDNGIARFALQYGGKIASEGIEEGIQEILDPIFKSLASDTSVKNWGGIDWGNVAYSSLLGGLSSGVFELSSSVKTNFNQNKLNPDEVISGMWEDSPNSSKDNVEKSQLESVESYDESGIIEETVDNDTGVPGKYTDEIVWSIFHHHPVRKFSKGYYGKRVKQHNTRVDNYELKINPNNESYYLQHPDGKYVQFENMVDNVLQDGKCILNKKRSFYHVYDYGYIAQKRVLEQANRQIEVANAAGYKVEWLVSDEKAVEQISRLFKENNINIIVKFYPE